MLGPNLLITHLIVRQPVVPSVENLCHKALPCELCHCINALLMRQGF